MNTYLRIALLAILVGTVSASQATELRVRPDVNAPEPGIILGNSTDCYVGAFKVRAVGLEDLVITSFSLHNRGVDETIQSVTVAYYDINGVLRDQSGFLVNGTVTFFGAEVLASEFPNQNSVIYVYIDSGDAVQADAGMRFRLDWIDLDFQAYGLNSGIIYDESIATDFRRGVQMIWHESKPTVSLSAGSPAGAGIPGYYEVLRFNMAADSRGNIGNNRLEFELDSSDNHPGGSGWNTCAQLADASQWEVYDLNAMPLSGNWIFKTEDGTDCYLAPDQVLTSVTLVNIGDTVAAGYTTYYSVYLDTTGADAAYDDHVHLGLIDIGWFDVSHPRMFNGRLVQGLPAIHNDPIIY